MKKTKKVLKILFIIMVIFVSVTLVGSITYYNITTRGLSLDKEKLQILNPTNTLTIYDINHNEIKPTSVSYVKLSKLSSATKNAFICTEDKRFYKHHGVDLLRIGGAIVSNLKSGSFSEGASTISQQLVKNTQLSNEKTISRKLKEIKLTNELEKDYSKDEILELYLNNIYFGNGCYGIENASKHYFNKPASNLSISESALLAGSINAPSIYDVINNKETAIKRRNLVLDLMHKQNKISKQELIDAKKEEIKLDINDISGNSSLYRNIIKEACDILKISEFKLNNSNYKIQTQLDKSLVNKIQEIQKNINVDCEKASIIINNKTHQIIAQTGKSNVIDSKWQPGSLIKPILVYAPAIEKDIISPATKLLDDKINISGYKPENADKKYHGYISAKTALSNSYNIPAVKLLNEIGIDEAKSFAENLGIKFTENDNHLALALGGFEKGVTAKSLCDAYSAFACNGSFQPSSYISKITKNGKTIYENKNNEKKVMKDSTAFLINEMLKDCAKQGTAKKLNSLKIPVCAKTGTVGKTNSNKNTLAYNIAYTKNYTVITLLQGINLPSNVNGSTYPTIINKEVLAYLNKNSNVEDFDIPSSIELVKLDKESYETNKLIRTDDDNSTNEYFAIANSPKKLEKTFKLTAINTPQNKPILCFTVNKNYDYFLIRKQKNKEEIIYSSLENNENFVKFIDKTAKLNEICEYKLKICEKSKNNEFFSNTIKLRSY